MNANGALTKTTAVEETEMELAVDGAAAAAAGAGAEDDARGTGCGVGSWRPRRLRPLGTIWSFTAAVSMLWVISGISVTYYSAVIPQIERRFGLSSSLSGFIRNVDNVGYVM